MNKRLTWYLTALAAVLFAFILFFERRIPGTVERATPPRAFPGVQAGEVQALQVSLPGGAVVRARRTNDLWVLTAPAYPAQQAAIEDFITNVVSLRRLDRIPAQELAQQTARAFGFDAPRAKVELETATNRISFEVGASTPLTNNVYLRLDPYGEVIVSEGTILAALPKTTNAWRSLDAIDRSATGFDHIQIRLGQRVFEVGRNATNNLWQITRPVPARADQNRIAALIEKVRGAQVHAFVSDAPAADLDRYGLQNPELELALLKGTNRVYSIQFGASPTNQPAEVFAELLGHTNVVLLPAALADFLKQPYKNFHDSRLVTFNPGSLDRVVVDAMERFALQRQPDGRWTAETRPPMPVDPELLQQFVGNILGTHIIDIVREVPTEADLKALGLLTPYASYSFFERQTNSAGLLTNVLFTEISFGSNQADRVYARRSDETPVYITPLGQMLQLPRRAFEVRDRQIWNLPATNIVRLTLSSAAGTTSIARAGSGWSEDQITAAAVDELVFRLSRLRALSWIAEGESRLKSFAITNGSPALEAQVTGSPAPPNIRFGRGTLRHDVYAAVVFPGETEPVIFEFPGEIYQSLQQLLPTKP